jgi:hypothetical protein
MLRACILISLLRTLAATSPCRILMPTLEDAWAAAVAQGMPLHMDLAGSSSNSSPQQQLQQLQQQLAHAAHQIGKELASLAATNLCKGLQQLPECCKQLFPLPQEVEEVALKDLLDQQWPFRMPSKYGGAYEQ